MIRPFLAAASLALALATTPAMAQQQPPTPETEVPKVQPGAPATQLDPGMVGQAVYSSDGQKVGEVIEVGMAGGTHAVRVEMGEFLGLGSSSVIVNANALERKNDRLELTMTANEIKQTLAKQREKPEQ